MAAKPVYAAGLDASAHTRIAICMVESGRLRFLGAGASESRGWVKGSIADQNAVAESILAALREAEANAGENIRIE